MENSYYIEGKNAVAEALRSCRPLEAVLLAENADKRAYSRIIAAAAQRGVTVRLVPKRRLDEASETKKHQGVMAVASAVEYAEVSDLLGRARERGEPPLIVILDHIEDPHNLGAILRTAEAAGAHGVVIPKRRAAGITAVVERAAAGAASHILTARVSNIAACIDGLKKEGVWVYCASADGEPLYSMDMTGAAAVVIGSEGSGASRLIMEKCDAKMAIPMLGRVTSLNASVAAGVVLYEVVRQRMKQK